MPIPQRAVIAVMIGLALVAVSGAREQGAPLQGVPPVADATTFAPLANRIDPYVARPPVVGVDGKRYTSDQATIWRWRQAFQHDFAARMDWTIEDVAHANHNPDVVVNGQDGKAPLMLDAVAGTPVVLDASKSSDRDRNGLQYSWFFHPEAGSGLPSAGGGRAAPTPRVTVTNGNAAVATVTPNTPGAAHVILAVTDDGVPALTSYRRIVLTIAAAVR